MLANDLNTRSRKQMFNTNASMRIKMATSIFAYLLE